MLVHIIADYGMGDLAFAEVVQRIKVHLPDMEPVLTPVPAAMVEKAGTGVKTGSMSGKWTLIRCTTSAKARSPIP